MKSFCSGSILVVAVLALSACGSTTSSTGTGTGTGTATGTGTGGTGTGTGGTGTGTGTVQGACGNVTDKGACSGSTFKVCTEESKLETVNCQDDFGLAFEDAPCTTDQDCGSLLCDTGNKVCYAPLDGTCATNVLDTGSASCVGEEDSLCWTGIFGETDATTQIYPVPCLTPNGELAGLGCNIANFENGRMTPRCSQTTVTTCKDSDTETSCSSDGSAMIFGCMKDTQPTFADCKGLGGKCSTVDGKPGCNEIKTGGACGYSFTTCNAGLGCELYQVNQTTFSIDNVCAPSASCTAPTGTDKFQPTCDGNKLIIDCDASNQPYLLDCAGLIWGGTCSNGACRDIPEDSFGGCDNKTFFCANGLTCKLCNEMDQSTGKCTSLGNEVDPSKDDFGVCAK